VVVCNFYVGWALAQQQSVALHLTTNGALRALLGQGPTYIYIVYKKIIFMDCLSTHSFKNERIQFVLD
jgi:hypothetical protein